MFMLLLELSASCLFAVQHSCTILSCSKQWLGGPAVPQPCEPLVLSNDSNYN